jgi:hypothetical protein
MSLLASMGGQVGAGLLSAVAGGLFGTGTTKTVTPSYTPGQTAMQGQEASAISAGLSGADLTPEKVAAMSGVNQNYSDLSKNLAASYSARGFGRSGKLLTNQIGLDVSRAGDLGSLDSRFAALQLQQENTAVGQAQQFGFANPATTTQQSAPGGVAGNALNSGLSTLTTLYGLNRMLSGQSKGVTWGNPTGGGGVFDPNAPGADANP